MFKGLKTHGLIRNKYLLLSIILFLISLTQTAFVIDDFDGKKTSSGIECLLIGSTAFLGGALLEWITWLANPLFILSIFLAFSKSSKALLISRIAATLAFSFSFWQNILAAENGRTASIDYKGLGYYLWLGSLIVWSIGLSISVKKLNAKSETVE